ncbi:MAG: DNA polymerase III subunit delta' [Casimicrobiaceae bacterium]
MNAARDTADDGQRDEGRAVAPTNTGLLPWTLPLLQRLLASRASLPHAMMITGAAGIGKRSIAMHMAQALLCEAPRDDGLACSRCPSCGYFAAGQHPDLRVLEPLKIDDDGDVKRLDAIPVEQVRELRDLVELTTHRGGNKVGVIVPAERMNTAAANALLKTLEEPPAGTYLLLVAHQPGRLPATITSRCRRIPVQPPDREAARRWLAEQGVDNATAILAQANGAPLAALGLADPAAQAERAVWLAALAEPRTLSPTLLSARIDAGARELRKDRLADAIDWLIAWTTDLARVAAGAPAVVNPDRAGALEPLAARVARISLSRYHRELLRQRARIAHPLTPRLAVEALLIDYRALFDHGR